MTMAADKQDKVLNFSSEREQSGTCSSSAKREKNQGKNFLNVPNKREQSQTSLDSAERSGLRPQGNVPNLRFPEFKDEWVRCKVSDVLDFYTTNSLSWDQLEYNSDELLNLHYGLIHVGLPTVVDLDENVLPNIKKKFLPKNYELCREGDVAFADASEDTNEVAKAIEFVNLSDKSVVCGLHTIHGRDNQNLTSIGFKGYAFASESFHNQIRRIAQGTKIFSISSKNFTECYIGIPSKDEQTKIAKLLTLIDQRISTQIRIIEKLQSLIKGLNNELMDNPKWTKIYIDDFMEFFPTNSLSWELLSYDNGHVHNLHYGLIHSGLPTLVDCLKVSLPYILDSSLPKQYTDCKDGDVAFADASEDTAEVGKVVELTNTGNQKIVCGLHTIHGRDVKGITVKGFKGFAFNSKYFHNQLRRIAQGSKVYSINTDNLKSCYLYIPTIAEQQKIVGLLHCLQDKIGVAEQELFLYESQKRFLLNNLFV